MTAGHLLGSILLLKNLARKNNTKSMMTYIEKLCSVCPDGISLERAKINNKFKNTIADVEKNLMDNELNHHALKCIGDASHRF
jgi:hypothetical protein